MVDAVVTAVSRDASHRFTKAPQDSITLVAGIGVAGDAHAGELVQHRSRVRRDPNQPNLRQVHLLHEELLEEARDAGHDLGPGGLGENILTSGLDLHSLPTGTRLRLGDAVVRLTGLRNPCRQIEDFSAGLLKVVVTRTAVDEIVRKAGVMAVVDRGGDVRPGSPITVELPDGPAEALRPV